MVRPGGETAGSVPTLDEVGYRLGLIETMLPTRTFRRGLIREGHLHVNSGHYLTFFFPEETLSAAVFMPRPSYRLLTKIVAPSSATSQRFTATAGTAGSGTNTIVLESSTNRSTWTVRATAPLNAATEAETTAFAGWVWNPRTEYLRVRASVTDAAGPKDVHALFEYD